MVRRATPEEFAHLRWVELESDKLMGQAGIGPLPEDDGEDRLAGATVVFASGDPAVGFVSVTLVDDGAHVDQPSVLPAYGRRGIGRVLLDRAIGWARDEGLAGVTPTTFCDVPWSAPFYRTVGFEAVSHPAAGLAAIRAYERASGHDALGPRVAMRLVC